MKLYFDSLTTLKVIHAESPIVIFFGTYGISRWFNFREFREPLIAKIFTLIHVYLH